jgi:nickel/cobalt transporter (NiCoT) family protein
MVRAGLNAAVAFLHGRGLVAYLFGSLHAFDADHIAAIDDTVRYMAQKGQRPLGVTPFSLGHSTIVMGLALIYHDS